MGWETQAVGFFCVLVCCCWFCCCCFLLKGGWEWSRPVRRGDGISSYRAMALASWALFSSFFDFCVGGLAPTAAGGVVAFLHATQYTHTYMIHTEQTLAPLSPRDIRLPRFGRTLFLSTSHTDRTMRGIGHVEERAVGGSEGRVRSAKRSSVSGSNLPCSPPCLLVSRRYRVSVARQIALRTVGPLSVACTIAVPSSVTAAVAVHRHLCKPTSIFTPPFIPPSSPLHPTLSAPYGHSGAEGLGCSPSGSLGPSVLSTRFFVLSFEMIDGLGMVSLG